MSTGHTMGVLFHRGVRRGFLTLWREREFGTTLAALSGILIIAQLLLVVTIGAQALQGLIRSRSDLRLEILDSSTDQESRDFFAAVQQLPYVDHAEFITRQKAYEQERTTDPELVAFLEKFKLENPFPDTIAVTLHSLADYDQFTKFIQEDQWRAVVDPSFLSKATDQEARIHELLRVTQAGSLIAILFLCLIAVVLLFILMEVVRRRALMRSEEVFIERLFGASDLAVMIPFATESVTILLLSLIFSMLFMLAFVWLLPTIFPALAISGVFGSLRAEAEPLLKLFLPLLFTLELVLAPILAFFGAWFGLRPQLRSRKLLMG